MSSFEQSVSAHHVAEQQALAPEAPDRDGTVAIALPQQFSAPYAAAGFLEQLEQDVDMIATAKMAAAPPDVFEYSPISDAFDIDLRVSLGVGMTGHVRPAVCKVTQQHFAVKILPDTLRARQEVMTQISLAQRSEFVVRIVRVFSNMHTGRDGCAEWHLFIVMERASTDLFQRVATKGPLSEAMCRTVVRSVSDALWHLHGQGLVHRDIKPENILISSTGTPLLGDFGFTGPCSELIHCSPAYAAPEVLLAMRARSAGRVGPLIGTPADMWSLGATMYLILGRDYPFATTFETAAAQERLLRGVFELPDTSFGHVSAECKDVMQRLMCVDAAQRMTLRELAEHPWMARDK